MSKRHILTEIQVHQKIREEKKRKDERKLVKGGDGRKDEQ
jgi:hypothetical protein